MEKKQTYPNFTSYLQNLNLKNNIENEMWMNPATRQQSEVFKCCQDFLNLQALKKKAVLTSTSIRIHHEKQLHFSLCIL